ncbi:Hypothetical protein CAP_0806 [Chondromyces apiculatus DSM 436]|uniref:Rhs-family protein n=1 Tax=Chondromyces apiculatus DSM 436 TaxID=1192034 RepID=A0A017TEH8_9BACT|nr:Hypothetical protein CAP_0806 [Chondromyces apiculatus DSM 436]
MGPRIYDPKLGRFLTPDPVVAHPWCYRSSSMRPEARG